MIGKGGSAEIYRGCLENGQLVAVKKITRGTTEEKTHNFLSEMGVLVHVDHPNTARLIGVGVEGGMHLVLVLSPHGSLANLLHGSIGRHCTDLFSPSSRFLWLSCDRFERQTCVGNTIQGRRRDSQRTRVPPREVPQAHHSSRYQGCEYTAHRGLRATGIIRISITYSRPTASN